MSTFPIFLILLLESCGNSDSVWNIPNLFGDYNLEFDLENYSSNSELYFDKIRHNTAYSHLVIDRVSLSNNVSNQLEKLYGFLDIASKKSSRGVVSFFNLTTGGMNFSNFLKVHK